jgi:hypothetical protein
MVFLGSSCRETAKNAVKKIEGEIRQEKSFFPQLFRPKVFDMNFPQKVFMVFLNSPCRETHKNAIKKSQKNN